MVPVDRAGVEPDADPPRRAEIGRTEINVGVAVDQVVGFVGTAGLDQYGGDAVGVMVLPPIGEEFPAVDEEPRCAVAEFLLGRRQRQRQRAEAVEQRVGARIARDEIGDDARVKLMFGVADARGKAGGRVAADDGNADRPEDRPAVEVGGDEVDRRAGDRIARRKDAFVDVRALVRRQQRRVDVDHPSRPARDEGVRQQAHVSGERDMGDARGGQLGVDQRIELGAGDAAVVVGEGSDPFGGGEREAGSGGVVRRDQYDLIGRIGQAGGIDQRRHIAAGARDEDGQSRFRPRLLNHGA